MTTIAALFCCTMTMMAEPVSPAAARQAAARFLQEKGAKLERQATEAPRRAMGQSADGQESSPYYVFNATGSKGFVVVSGDDCVGGNLVLGYTDRGCFDAGNVPVNMQEWLDAIASQITSMSRRGATARAIALHDAVAPLVTTTWGQGKPAYDPHHPYNALCPKFDGQLSVTGCMATALSQVLYYHRTPQQPIVGDLPGYTMFTNPVDMEPLPGVKFDWDNMLDNYSGETTEAQQMAVATLMRYCGQTLQMDYTPYISNAYSYDLDLLITQFGIDQGAHTARAYEYSINAWDSLLYTELKEQRPLLHTGFSMGGGHAFVLDGYEAKDGVGYFHVNWGWDGDSDGYYRLDVLNPYASGTGGSSTSDGFSIGQDAVIGFQPSKGPLDHYGRYLVGFEWNAFYDDQPGYFATLNTSHMPVNYALAMAERMADGSIDYDHVLGEQTLEIENYSYAGLQKEEERQAVKYFTVLDHVADNLTPGSHRLVFINKEVGTDAPWRPVFGPNCSVEIIVGDDGQPTDTIIHPSPVLTTTARTVKVLGLGELDDMKMWGLRQTVKATVANNSADAFNGTLYCTLYLVVNDVLTVEYISYRAPVFVEANGKTEVNFDVYPPRKGNYVAVITSDYVSMKGRHQSDLKSVDGYVGSKPVIANELTFTVQSFEHDVTTTEEGELKTRFNITVGNSTAMDYESFIVARVYKMGSDSIYHQVVFNNGYDYKAAPCNVKSKERADISFVLPQLLEPGDYSAEFQMSSDYIGNKLSDYFSIAGSIFKVEESTGIKTVGTDQTANGDKWFSLDGRRLDARPTTKGVYVRQGKKLVVR